MKQRKFKWRKINERYWVGSLDNNELASINKYDNGSCFLRWGGIYFKDFGILYKSFASAKRAADARTKKALKLLVKGSC